jgi:hypothetical protein
MIRLACRRIALCIVTGALSLPAQSRPDIISTGNGTRAIGLSQAVTASVSDIAAIGWNPAGLAHISGIEVMFTARVLGFAVFPRERGEAALAISLAEKMSVALDGVDFVGVAQSFAIGDQHIVAGVAWRRFAEGIQGGGIGAPDAVTMFRSTGGTRAFSPSISTALTPGLHAGVTVNLLHGSAEHVEDRSTTTFDRFVRELDQSGIALDLGAQYDLAEGYRLGVLATLPHDLAMRFEQDTIRRNVTRTAPLALAVGIEIETSPRTRMSADFRSADWSASTLRDDDTGEAVASPVGQFAMQSVHVGFEWDGLYTRGTTANRFGLYYRQSSVADAKNKPITEVGAGWGRSWRRLDYVYDVSLGYSKSSQWSRTYLLPDVTTASDQQLTVVFGVRWKR